MALDANFYLDGVEMLKNFEYIKIRQIQNMWVHLSGSSPMPQSTWRQFEPCLGDGLRIIES